MHNGKYRIASVRDLTTGVDTSQPNRQTLLPSSKSGQMITFSFENGAVITLRTSGTEPKIKYYAEMCANPSEKYVVFFCLFNRFIISYINNLLMHCIFVYFFFSKELGRFADHIEGND